MLLLLLLLRPLLLLLLLYTPSSWTMLGWVHRRSSSTSRHSLASCSSCCWSLAVYEAVPSSNACHTTGWFNTLMATGHWPNNRPLYTCRHTGRPGWVGVKSTNEQMEQISAQHRTLLDAPLPSSSGLPAPSTTMLKSSGRSRRLVL